MSARITPLRLECFEQLPKHARRCVFWEVDPTALGRDDHFADPEFEKEAWLSMVMLEWGACGQIAVPVPELDQECIDRAVLDHRAVFAKAGGDLAPAGPLGGERRSRGTLAGVGLDARLRPPGRGRATART